MIESFLREEGLAYLQDREGSLMVPFAETPVGSKLEVWFTAEGDANAIYRITGRCPLPVTSAVADWYQVCNEWNFAFRWPTVYLARDSEASRYQLVLEGQVDLACGISRELFALFSRNVLTGCFGFFTWLEQLEHRQLARVADAASGVASDLDR